MLYTSAATMQGSEYTHPFRTRKKAKGVACLTRGIALRPRLIWYGYHDGARPPRSNQFSPVFPLLWVQRIRVVRCALVLRDTSAVRSS
jgi:hypothetical protein